MNKKRWELLFKPQAWIAKVLLIFFVAGFFLLAFLGYLQPIKVFLGSDELAAKISEIPSFVYLIIKAIIILVIFFWLADILFKFGKKHINATKRLDDSNKALITKGFQISIYLLGVIIGLSIIDIDLTAFAIFSSAIVVGIGFGLQKITSNFISGLILLLEKSVEKNDLVELADSTYGFIRHTGARYTLVETFEGKEIMIPNEDFITNRVTNWTFSNRKGRIEINISVSYESDIEKTMKLIVEAAKEHPRCINDPEPVCYLREFADSAVNFLLFFWVADVTEGRYGPKSDVMQCIWKKFKEHNVTIPYPQRDLHIKNSEAIK